MKLTFDLAAPKTADLGTTHTLWSTYYYAHAAKETTSGVPLWSSSNKPLGPKLAQKDWCLAAMEGTVKVALLNGNSETYNYSGKGSSAQTSCKAVFPNLNDAVLAGTERVRWKVSKGPYGEGSGGHLLVPCRTLAVDTTVIKLGTVLYIAAARGVQITLPDGSKVSHDGYFFAGDVGGAIKSTHVDTFLGVTSRNPFTHVKSKPQDTFEARVVANKMVISFLQSEHAK